MPPRHDTEITRSSILSIIVTLLLFLLAQVVAALLIGSVALAVSPTRAAEFQHAASIRPGDAAPARCCWRTAMMAMR